MSIYQFLKRMAKGGAKLKYGRHLIRDYVLACHDRVEGTVDILDIGCGDCGDLFNIENALKGRPLRLHGLDFRPREHYGVDERVEFKTANIEEEPLPYEDGSMDFVICNQIYEHCKEIFFLTSEIARILKPGGKAIIGVPNLSSVHALVMLLMGRQPPPIFIIGPHVRGFCANGLTDLLEFAGTFKLIQLRGAGFYPFPAPLAKAMAYLFPRYSVTLMGLFEKTGSASNYLASLRKIKVESSFRGWTFAQTQASPDLLQR